MPCTVCGSEPGEARVGFPESNEQSKRGVDRDYRNDSSKFEDIA